MARPQKARLDYFPLDVDIFEDDKVALISSEFGAIGESILIRLLCKIYKNGYYYRWGGDECLLFCKWAGGIFVQNQVEEVLMGCLRRSIFDKRVFEMFSILTSTGIQKRYIQATNERKGIEIIPDIWLIETPAFSKITVFPPINEINPPNNSIIRPINTQSKEKKIKEKESNNETVISTPATTPFIQSFPNRQSVADLIDQFKTEEMFCENCMRELFIKDQSELFTYFDRFKAFLLSTDQAVKTPKDCKIHFMNWCRKNKSFSTPQSSNFNKYTTYEKVEQAIPPIFYDKVKKLYPDNNFYSVKLFDQYMEYHGFTPEQALKHFERAYLKKIPYPILILKVQSEKVLLFKN